MVIAGDRTWGMHLGAMEAVLSVCTDEVGNDNSVQMTKMTQVIIHFQKEKELESIVTY